MRQELIENLKVELSDIADQIAELQQQIKDCELQRQACLLLLKRSETPQTAEFNELRELQGATAIDGIPLWQRAREIIKKAGKDQTTKQVLEQLVCDGWSTDSPNPSMIVYQAMSRKVGKIFSRRKGRWHAVEEPSTK